MDNYKYVLYNIDKGYIEYIEKWWDGVIEYGYIDDIRFAKVYASASSARRAKKNYTKRTQLKCVYIKCECTKLKKELL